MPIGRRVVIQGADLAAIELAEFLAAAKRRVSIVATGDRLAGEVGHKRRTEHMDTLDRLGVAVNTGVVCERITRTGVVVRPERGTVREIAADTVILAGEVEPDTGFLDAVRDLVPEAHAVGDCTGLGLIRKATEEGMRVGCNL
jgi:2,4-dienoyl-CoA reductase (NADPH2)